MRNLQLNPAENRRAFLRGAARYGLLAALVGVSARAARLELGPRAGQRCLNRGVCRSCGVFPTCSLPAALSAKQAPPGG